MSGKWFRYAWGAWFVVLAVGFTVVEWLALKGKRHERDTLTSNIQWAVKKDRPEWVKWGSAFAWVGFAAWFTHHIWA